ncbi:MAG: galactose mutarotase [Colwellia sp.]
MLLRKNLGLTLLNFWVLGSLISCSAVTNEEIMETEVSVEKWGKAEGETAYLYTLKNDNGVVVKVSNWGAYIQSIIVPDRDGNFEDVVIGYDTWQEYYDDCCYSGPVVGRFANRIAKGKFSIDGVDYQLTTNDGGENGDVNQLHGGEKGLHKRFWDSRLVKNGVELTYVSPDGEEGYPGTLTIKVSYTLSQDNELKLEYQATTDKTTYVNLTSHVYLNLSGERKRNIEQHELLIKAKQFTPVDTLLIPTGELRNVANTPFDFTVLKPVGKDIRTANEQLKMGGGVDQEFGGYDHNWVFTDSDGSLKEQAALYEPISGRYMDILTQEPALQFYTGNFMDSTVKGKNNKIIKHRDGLALETQNFPDAPNQPTFPSTLLTPDNTFHSITVYKFGVK